MSVITGRMGRAVVLVAVILLCGCAGKQPGESGARMDGSAQAGAAPGKAQFRDINEIAKDFRPPTAQEIAKLGRFWWRGPAEENAAHWLALAVSKLQTSDPPPGSADVPLKYYAGDQAAMEKWAQRNQPALEALREGLKRGEYCTPIIVYSPTTVPRFDIGYLNNLHKLTRMLTDAGFLDELRGRPDAAAQTYLDCMRLGMIVRRRPTLIEELVGVSLAANGMRMLDRLIAGGKLNDETLRAVIAECRKAEVGEKEPLAVWEEDMAFKEAVMAVHGDNAAERKERQAGQRRAAALKDVLEKRTLDELLQKNVRESLYKGELKELAEESAKMARPRSLPSDWAFEVTEPLRWIIEMGKMNVALRATETRAGIALYQEAHGGALPQTLDALCPDILPAVPTDPFSGKPMRFARTAEGWKAWSVAVDNTDNGGVATSSYADTWHQEPDMVFWSRLPSNLDWRSGNYSPPIDLMKSE